MKNVAANTVSANTKTFLDSKRQQQHSPQQDTVNTVTATAIEVPLSFTKQQIHDSINNAIAILSNGLIERKEDSKLVVLAFLANEHILLLGKPGTGKSVLGLRLSKLLASATGSGSSSSLLSGNNNNNNNNGSNNTQTQTPQIFFQRLLTKFTTPEELFGPLSLKALENDIYRRNTVGYLPTCQIAFLDEIFKANSSILNTLLTILNERKFDNGIPIPEDSNVMVGGGGTIRENCPIRTVVGASNELGNDSDELIALYDRFLIRKEVLPVSDENIIQLLQLQQQSQTQSHQSQSQQSQQESENENEIDDDNNNNNKESELVELDDIIKYLSSTVDDSNSIMIDHDACLILKNLRIYLRDNHDITISDRRLVKIVKLVKLSAACDLRTQVDPIIDFIGILQHCLWNIPSERIIIRDWLWDNITPLDYSNNGDGGNITPNQLRFLLQNLRQEILDILKNKTNGCIETGGAVAQIVKQDDIKVLDSLRIELENIIIIAQTKMNSLVRHIALIHRLELKDDNFALWMDPEDVSTIQQVLLPRAELLLPEIKSVVEDATVLKQTISISSIPIIPSNYLRINIVEMIWELEDEDDSNSNGYRDFTSKELQMTSKAAQSKYDLETFRRWKRAIKKQK
ncbi:AAA_5-domain-containing protein [Fragilariopsis cylindrus CCMP1102]|uniref:AAA_5-domain-containing protein n=1 Tax=Fragilariopsis cylindrus CCMP1102 TaxID=635003 RepID=A0A1E7F3Z5_9STRA|nr:AAA_5-domain-containing protein [Fragilariopsis cylindrus CCMP1102]|eukprot:OEU12918.1 AAA_5-domain-containing protein [Fragilariopsis cylindrus CCMP1102]